MGRLMEEFRRIYWDANIVIGLVQGKSDISRQIRVLVGRMKRRSPPFLVTSELTYAETLVKPYRDRDERSIAQFDNWSISNPVLEVRPVTRRVLHEAAVLRAQHKSLRLPDAIHLATAFDAGCSHVLSGDLRLSDEYNLSPERYGWSAPVRSVCVVRPTVEVIGRLIEASS
jgi:predicted nucleic acid-binding protein